VSHIVSVDFVKAYAYTDDSDDCGGTFRFPFFTTVCTIKRINFM
jgi:hypothetical protein